MKVPGPGIDLVFINAGLLHQYGTVKVTRFCAVPMRDGHLDFDDDSVAADDGTTMASTAAHVCGPGTGGEQNGRGSCVTVLFKFHQCPVLLSSSR